MIQTQFEYQDTQMTRASNGPIIFFIIHIEWSPRQNLFGGGEKQMCTQLLDRQKGRETQ